MGLDLNLKIDKVLCAFFFLLLLIGILLQYSANYPGEQPFFNKHLLWIAISLPAGFFFFLLPVRKIKHYANILYFIGIFLLIMVIFLPGSEGRWIRFSGFQFQPSEIMKLFFIIALAKVFIDIENKKIYFTDLITPIILTAAPIILIFIEPDIGTSVIFFFILYGMIGTLNIDGPRYFLLISPILSLVCGLRLLPWIIFMAILVYTLFISELNFKKSLGVFFLNIISGSFTPILTNLLKPYQKERLLNFLNPSWDPTGAGWHLLQSKIAIGSGGFFGKGYLNGIIKNLGFLPQTRTDFIFAVLGEEFGYLGTIAVLVVFGLFLMRILHVVKNAQSSFGKFLGYGIFFYFLSQISVNIAMTVGLLPVVGLPLPFLSYGGTSMLISVCSVGILLSINNER